MYKDSLRGSKVMAVTASWVLGKHLHGWERHQGFASSSSREGRRARNAKSPTDGIPHTSLQMSIMQMPMFEVAIPR